MTNLDHIIKSRDITLPKEVCLVKAMIFPGVMCGCEHWTITKAEWWKIAAFELWGWRRLLRVPWIERRSNQSFLKGINLECSWDYRCWSWSSKLLATYGKSWLIGKDPDVGKDGREKEKEAAQDEMFGWHHWMDMTLSQLQEMVKHREPRVLWIMGSQSEVTEQLNKSNNTELQNNKSKIYCKQRTILNNTILILVAQF